MGSPEAALLDAYRVYILIHQCSTARDQLGQLLDDSAVQTAKEATRRAEQKLAPRLNAGVTSTQLWDKAIANPPNRLLSRTWCAGFLRTMLFMYPGPIGPIESP
jgi:hypothetical protein